LTFVFSEVLEILGGPNI